MNNKTKLLKLNEVFMTYADKFSIFYQSLDNTDKFDFLGSESLKENINLIKQGQSKEEFLSSLSKAYTELNNVIESDKFLLGNISRDSLDFFNPNNNNLSEWYDILASNEFSEILDNISLRKLEYIGKSFRESSNNLNSLIETVEDRLDNNNNIKEDVFKKLQKIYPEIDEKFLCETANEIGDKVRDLGEKIDVTGSEIVIPIITKNGIDYFKGTNNKNVIIKESEWVNLAKQNYLTRIANVSYKGLVESKKYAGIITKATQNEFNKDEYEDFKKYIKVKENIIGKYASMNNLDSDKLLVNSVVASIFNTAINHVYIGPHIDNKILAKSFNSRLKSFEELEERAKKTSNKYALTEFRKLKEYYNLNLKKFNDQEEVGSKIIIHGDNRPGNLGIEQPYRSYVLGRKIDFGAARLGYVSEDLAKLETINNGGYVSLYNHIIKELGGVTFNDSNLIEKVNIESNLNDVRSLSFALSKNNQYNAKRYFRGIKQKNRIYKVA